LPDCAQRRPQPTAGSGTADCRLRSALAGSGLRGRRALGYFRKSGTSSSSSSSKTTERRRVLAGSGTRPDEASQGWPDADLSAAGLDWSEGRGDGMASDFAPSEAVEPEPLRPVPDEESAAPPLAEPELPPEPEPELYPEPGEDELPDPAEPAPPEPDALPLPEPGAVAADDTGAARGSAG